MYLLRGFSMIEYNYVIRLAAIVEVARSLTIDEAQCKLKVFFGVSYNKHSIGICYVDGLDEIGNAADTRIP
nr:MAG TPA_asm: lysozyme [Caudoviricetes sp.]